MNGVTKLSEFISSRLGAAHEGRQEMADTGLRLPTQCDRPLVQQGMVLDQGVAVNNHLG